MNLLRSMPVLVSLWLMVPAAPARAAELDPAHLPADAKWVLHVDFEAISDTEVMKQVRENRPQVTQQIRKWFENQYGIDPREDLKGATAFSDTYASRTGTLILHAKYDQQKVKSDLQKKEGVKTTQWEDHTLYTVNVEKRMQKKLEEKLGKKVSADREDGKPPTVTLVLLDGDTVVAASSAERVQQAIKLLRGDAPSLKGRQSALTEKAPEGTFLYGAAVQLQQIDQHDGVFPVLSQHERIVWAVGGQGNEFFKELTLVAQSAEVAEQMEKVMHGLVAFQKVWAGDSQPLRQLTDSAKISRQGNTVRVEGRGEQRTVVAALRDVADRAQQVRQARRR